MANGQPTTARDIIIAILIFGGLITGTFTMIAASIPSNAGNFTDYNRSFNQFANLKSNADSMASSTQDAEPDEGVEGILSGLYSSSFGAIRQLWTSITTMKTVIEETSEGSTPFKMPVWFTGLLVTIISVTFAFALIASWRKWHT